MIGYHSPPPAIRANNCLQMASKGSIEEEWKTYTGGENTVPYDAVQFGKAYVSDRSKMQ